jgi:two-component system response regulator AtoC
MLARPQAAGNLAIIMKIRVLIIEDESLIRWSLRQKLEEQGYTVDEASDAATGLDLHAHRNYDLILLDYKLPDLTGLDVLRKVREHDSESVIIMITAFSRLEQAVEAIRLGAYDYIAKPFNMDELMFTIQKGLETTELRRQVRELRGNLQREFGFDKMIGRDESMVRVFDLLQNIAQSGASTVFLRGDSGTGKDLAARIIHHNSDRAHRRFMNITCTALSETLLESELFGHERGAFTDARQQKKGLLELADSGTVFLDEVGDMPPALQAKLLRFLEERAFRRVGGIDDISVDVRVIAATNRDIEKAIREGQFREDLYYRLNVVPVYLPPLRERGDDIRLLTQHFVSHFAKEFKKNVVGVSEAAYAKLQNYPWEGNVRELRNVIERAALLCRGEHIEPTDIALGRLDDEQDEGLDVLRLPTGGLDLARVEEHLCKEAMRRTNNNQTQAAKLLHISRDQLRYRLEKFGIIGVEKANMQPHAPAFGISRWQFVAGVVGHGHFQLPPHLLEFQIGGLLQHVPGPRDPGLHRRCVDVIGIDRGQQSGQPGAAPGHVVQR